MKFEKNKLKRLANKIKVILLAYKVLELICDLIGLVFNYLIFALFESKELGKKLSKKIYLGPGKYAYEQLPEHYDSGLKLVKKVLKIWTPPSYYYHYQKGGHLAALLDHEDSTLFTKLDLSRFFTK